MFLGSHLLSFACRTQKGVALSSGEAELTAQVSGVSEGLGIRNLMQEWGLSMSLESLCDSSAARGVLNRTGCGRIRHLELKHLWVQDLVQRGQVRVRWIPRAKNTADILTHPCGVPDLSKGLKEMGVVRLGAAGIAYVQSGRWGVLGIQGSHTSSRVHHD